MKIQFTTEVQQMLNALGFSHTHHPANWRDVGGPENGPKLIGNPEYDEYSKGNTSVYVQYGLVQDVETTTTPEPVPVPF